MNRSATSGPAAAAPQTEPPAPVRFPGLDALRVYAVVSIVVAHTSRNFANLRPAPAEIPLLNVLLLDAQTAVNLFFVLSGFLITCRLLAEQAAAGRLDVRRFLARRMARILPP